MYQLGLKLELEKMLKHAITVRFKLLVLLSFIIIHTVYIRVVRLVATV